MLSVFFFGICRVGSLEKCQEQDTDDGNGICRVGSLESDNRFQPDPGLGICRVGSISIYSFISFMWLQKWGSSRYNKALNLFCLLDSMVKPFLLKTAKIRQKFLRKNFFNRLRGFPSHVVCVIHVDI